MKRFILLTAIGLGVWSVGMPGANPASADVVHLTDGTSVSGEIKKTDDGWIVTPPGGKPVMVPSAQVESIEVQAADGPAAAEDRLASLRRAAENIDDIKVIVSRYQSFINQNSASPAAAEAQGDLDQWRDRQVRGLVKVGTDWVTPEEKAESDHKATLVAEDVRQLLAQGKVKEASSAIEKTLTISPENVSLLYLRGVVAYRQEQLVPARKSFEAVVAQAPDDGPSLNNLAVITWRQDNVMVAMNYYDQAMVAAPMSRQILDNVAEALNSLPAEKRKWPVVEKAVRHFNEQDTDLQKKLAEKGLSRWGSSWITDAQRAKFEAAAKAAQDQIDTWSGQYDDLTARITHIDQSLNEDQTEISNIQNSSIAQTSDGRLVQIPYPPRYYDLTREVEALKTERIQDVNQQATLHNKAVDLKNKQPSRYTGIQRIIDIEGMPIAVTPSDPATQPTAENSDPPIDLPATQPMK